MTVYDKPLAKILKLEIGFLRAIVYIVIISLAVGSFMFVSVSIFNSDVETLFQDVGKLTQRSQALLYISPDSARYKVGDEFDVNIMVNTKENNVVVVAAYLSYNMEILEALSIELTQSNFRFTAEKEINRKEGKVKITLGQPTPGINSDKGMVARIHFKALGATVPMSDNIYFDFTSGSSQYSTVIVDDKKGTNILSSTNGASVTIED